MKTDPLDFLTFPEGTRLLITSLSSDEETDTIENWYNLSMQGLNEAYGENEPEYTLENIKEFNPDYER